MGGCLIIAVAVQDDFGAAGAHRIYLDARRVTSHNYGRLDAKALCRHGHALSMIARRSGYHAPSQLYLGQLTDLVVGTAYFEAEYRLQVFTFQAHVYAQAFA